MQNPPVRWPDLLDALKSRLGAEVCSRWLEPLRVVSVTEQELLLQAPNQFFKDWVVAHYADAIGALLAPRQLRVVTATSPGLGQAIDEAVNSLRAASAGAAKSAPGSGAAAWEQPLNPKCTFDRFVVGPSNRFAHAASLAVAESPAKAYNPLFIYGGVGLGKTHLMQAIGQAIISRWPSRRVVYISSEGFTNELIAAIQNKTTARFRERYRTVDVLLVDDIHFIAGKEATQEEFFHTFNTLYDAHKQIVISSDRSPKEIAGLEERLVSRFEWGLVTDIQPPDLETRIAILRKKAEEANVEVRDEVTMFIGQQITSNIRELEGALIRVLAYCQFFNKPQTAAVAQEVLRDMVHEVSARVTIDGVQRRIAEYFQLTVPELRSARRHRSILYPRQVAMYLCRRLTDASLPEIGRAFGGRDHTTVMHAVEKVEREFAQDAHKKRLIEHLQQLVTNTPQPEGALASSTFPHA